MNNRIINFIDLEATCWEDGQKIEQQEIIQIGLVQYNTHKRKIQESYQSYVMPRNSELGEYCTDLTGIRPENLTNAPYLQKISKDIRLRFGGTRYPWMSWGRFDETLIEKECIQKDIPKFVTHSHTNLKKLVAFIRGTKGGSGLKSLCEHLDLGFEGDHHDAYWDAFNCANVFHHYISKLDNCLVEY